MPTWRKRLDALSDAIEHARATPAASAEAVLEDYHRAGAPGLDAKAASGVASSPQPCDEHAMQAHINIWQSISNPIGWVINERRRNQPDDSHCAADGMKPQAKLRA